MAKAFQNNQQFKVPKEFSTHTLRSHSQKDPHFISIERSVCHSASLSFSRFFFVFSVRHSAYLSLCYMSSPWLFACLPVCHSPARQVQLPSLKYCPLDDVLFHLPTKEKNIANPLFGIMKSEWNVSRAQSPVTKISVSDFVPQYFPNSSLLSLVIVRQSYLLNEIYPW